MTKIKRFIMKIDQNSFKILPRLKRFFLRIHPVKEYLKRCNQCLDNNEPFKAVIVLKKGLIHYPNSYYLNRKKAIIEVEIGNEKQAKNHWKIVLKKHEKKASKADYIEATKNLLALKEEKQAQFVLEQGLRSYPNSIELLNMVSELYIQAKKWRNVTVTLSKLFLLDKYTPTVEDFINLSHAYYKENDDKAEYLIQQGIKEYSGSSKLLLSYIHLSIQLKKWKNASYLIRFLSDHFDIEYSNTHNKLFGMVHQVLGDKEKADIFFDYVLKNNQSIPKESVSHKKITLFDNGESRIDFYKRNTKTNKVIITFDSLNMTWDKPSFGFKLLSEQNVDIIAVQKRQKKTYHQDMSLDNFLDTVEKLVSLYKTRISYGFSLGAYSVIYYTGALDCTILSLAPRLSIHPVYGKKAEIGETPFHHNLSLRKNEHVKPIIVYDPKDKIDYLFIKNEVLKAYPQAHLVKIPYGGHSMGPHLLRMGLLKEFILTVIEDDQIPVYNRKRKTKSANYYRLLGRECFRRKKVRWAKELSDCAYELLPEDPLVVKLKVDILLENEQYEEAEYYMHMALKDKAKRLSYRMTLIDIYILQGNLLKAEEELEYSAVLLGEQEQIVAKRIKIQNEYQNSVKRFVFKLTGEN